MTKKLPTQTFERSFGPATLALAILAAPAASLAQTVEPDTTATTIYLNYANVIANGSSILLNRLPIKLPNGTIIYKDVDIELKASSTGVLTVSPAKPVQTLSPAVLSANFQAGTYIYPSNAIYGLAVTGPGLVSGSSLTKWTTTAASKLRTTCGMPAVFYVGAVKENPYYATRLKPAGISSAEYSYGVAQNDAGCTDKRWAPGALLGFSQTGNLITVASFTNAAGNDLNVPQAIYSYRAQ